MKIAEVSKKYGISADTLRYYEKVGLISPVAFCAVQWPLVRLPVATQRWQWPELIGHFPFNHDDVVLCHPFKERVRCDFILHQHGRPRFWLALRADNAAP